MEEVVSGAILCSIREQVATLTINRPEVMNAVNKEVRTRLPEFARRLDADSSVRAIVITGAGDRAFCAGADLKERAGMPVEDVFLKLREPIWAIEIFKVMMPTIAAVNGYALGGGTELALACDFRIASEKAVFGLTEINHAIIPGAGGTQLLPRLVGLAKAKELILTGKKIDAAEAERIGLVTRVVPHEQLLPAAYELARELSRFSPLALRMAKRAVTYGALTDLGTGLSIETDAAMALLKTKDRVEALRAFREKREPVYTGE